MQEYQEHSRPQALEHFVAGAVAAAFNSKDSQASSSEQCTALTSSQQQQQQHSQEGTPETPGRTCSFPHRLPQLEQTTGHVNSEPACVTDSLRHSHQPEQQQQQQQQQQHEDVVGAVHVLNVQGRANSSQVQDEVGQVMQGLKAMLQQRLQESLPSQQGSPAEMSSSAAQHLEQTQQVSVNIDCCLSLLLS